MRDKLSLSEYGENLLGVRQAIPRILELFSEYGIHATWATVGFIFCSSREQLLAAIPSEVPQYEDDSLSPYKDLNIGDNEVQDPFHFAPSLISQVQMVPGQEIGTHTFSHYYCLEPGQTVEAFRADLEASISVSATLGNRPVSLVFPRNQINHTYLAVCRELGIMTYRGNEQSWLYAEVAGQQETSLRRLVRLADAYINLTGHHTFEVLHTDRIPINIPSSRFLRPYSRRLSLLEPLRLRRILSGLEDAAHFGRTFHLWWHPHNFGRDLNQNLAFLRQILENYQRLSQTKGMRSLNMGEIAQEALKVRIGE